MELRHLRYFVAVAEEQNVTRAAARLNVSQPPLSRQIHDLEDELGLPLFERTAKSIRLTDAGRVFLSEARAILARVAEATQTVKSVATAQHGEIHVGYAPSLMVELLPDALREFQRLFPGVRVKLHDASTEEMLAQLRKGDLHLAFTVKTPRRGMAGLNFEELRSYRVCVAAHPGHPVVRGRTATLRQLAEERILGYTRADYPEYHDWLTGLFAPARVTVAEEHDSATSLIAAVETGRGIAVVPQSFSCFAGDRLKLRPVSPNPPPFIVGVTRPVARLSKAAEGFIAAARMAAGRASRS